MATPNTLDTSIGESNNNAPIVATASLQRTWNRLFSALSRRQQDTGQDEVERGEHRNHSTSTINVGEGSHEEHAEAGATPPIALPATATNGQHQSPFSSTAFDRLPQPVPVGDIFFGSWWLILALRTATRPVVIFYSYSLMCSSLLYSSIIFLEILAIYLVRWMLLRTGRDSTPFFGVPIPGKRRLFWAQCRLYQKLWEHIIGRIILKNGDRWRRGLCLGWWFVYMLITPMAEFRQNYLAAWRQRKQLSIHIFVDDENISVPIPTDGTDKALLARIRSFYHMMLVGQGFPALVFPKQLQRIDYVQISKDSLVLGSRLGTLQLGRYKGRLVNIFENPELAAHTFAVAETVRAISENSALEFQRSYDVGAISIIVAVPPVASLIFAIVWIRVYVNQRNVDLQVGVQTAFTVSSYIVTAGALTLALIAFLDQKRAQNDDMVEKIERKSFETHAVTTSKIQRRSSLP